MEERPFTITSFAWKQDIERRLAAGGEEYDSDDILLQELSALASFLEKSGLSIRKLTINGHVGQDFVLRSTDLTPRGLELIRYAYEKWYRRKKAPNDVRPLEKALEEITAKGRN